MTFLNFLLQTGWNWLTYTLPLCVTLFFTVRLAVRYAAADIAKLTRQQPTTIHNHGSRIVNE